MGTIAVCDTEPIAIEGLRSLLDGAEGLRMVATETSLMGGVDAARELLPSILIVDRAFGLYAVMDCLKALRKIDAPTAVIVWGNTVAEPEAVRLVQAGAAGVMRKTSALASILNCLRSVAQGTTWLGSDLLDEPDRSVRAGHSPLTARERQVAELVERGFRNKDIAAALGIRTGTVKIHMKHIFEKTGIRGRYGLALSGLKEKGLLSEARLEVQ